MAHQIDVRTGLFFDAEEFWERFGKRFLRHPLILMLKLSMVVVGLLILELQIPGCASLKEKRRRLKPLLARLHKEFNVSAAEVEHHDVWQSAAVACTLVSNEQARVQRQLQKVAEWVERHWPDVSVVDWGIEIL